MFEEDVLGREAETLEDAWSEWIDQDVRGREEAEENVARLFIAQVEGDGVFAARELVGADCLGTVNAEDGGAVVGEKETGEGACGVS